MSLRRLANVVAIVAVLAAYAFFASGGTFDFPRLKDHQGSDYAALAEGFRQGHLYLAREPDPKLAALPYPWNFEARQATGAFYLWDVSFFNGRYYLYFTPLPVLLVHLPFFFVRGGYPPDTLVAAVFCAWTFLALVAFAKRALAMSGRKALIPFPLWILFIGAANVIPFVLAFVRTYEVAIVAGMAMTAMWALALLNFNESPTIGRTIWLSVWLALSIAARPNLGVLVFVTAAVVLLRVRTLKLIAAFFTPLAVVALAMIAYNFARFHEPFEFGVKYQLTHVSMEHHRVCSLCSAAEVGRLANNVMHYVFAAPRVRSVFPFVELPHAVLDPAVSWPRPEGITEQVAGLAPFLPLTILAAAFALLFLAGFAMPDTSTRASMQLLAGAWLILLGLSTCWWIVARYSLDFMLLMTAASVVCVEAGLARLRELGLRMMPLRVAVIVLACYSILLGLTIGFTGPGDSFRRANPELFEAIGVQGT